MPVEVNVSVLSIEAVVQDVNETATERGTIIVSVMVEVTVSQCNQVRERDLAGGGCAGHCFGGSGWPPFLSAPELLDARSPWPAI